MYIFFTIFGFFFIFLASVVIYYVYEIFPINKVTDFLNSNQKSIWNNINITVIPIIAWAYIELPILGRNPYFLLALLLNTCMSSAIIYVIKYWNLYINKKDNKYIDIISIFVGTVLGQIICYITWLLNVNNTKSLWISIIELLVYTAFIFLLKIWPPKSEFFRGEKK